MKTPQAGDMWHWKDKWGWDALFILAYPVSGMKDMWKCLMIDSNEVGEAGTVCNMSFSKTTVKGWTFIA